MKRTVSDALELLPMFEEELVLCKVRAGEKIVLFTDTDTDPLYPMLFMKAAAKLGAHCYQMVVPSSMKFLEGEHIARAWADADLVIGMSRIEWLYSHVHNEALKAGTRTLMVFERPEVLKRLFPCKEVMDRCIRGAELLTRGKVIRVVSDAGTDFVCSIEGRCGDAQYGVSDIPGRFDHWPSGLVGINPIPGTGEGALVFVPGDMYVPPGVMIREPIRMTVEKGKVVRVEGGLDAQLWREFMEAVGDDRVYAVPAHIGWGCDHRAKRAYVQNTFESHFSVMDMESFYGNVMIAFGRDLFGGKHPGSNDVALHLDFASRGMDLYVDQEAVVLQGRIVHPECS